MGEEDVFDIESHGRCFAFAEVFPLVNTLRRFEFRACTLALRNEDEFVIDVMLAITGGGGIAVQVPLITMVVEEVTLLDFHDALAPMGTTSRQACVAEVDLCRNVSQLLEAMRKTHAVSRTLTSVSCRGLPPELASKDQLQHAGERQEQIVLRSMEVMRYTTVFERVSKKVTTAMQV